MASHRISVVFFDLGDTLGTPVLSPPPSHLIGFEVFRYVPSILQKLRDQGLRLGVISNTGDDPGTAVNRILQDVGIVQFFDHDLLIYSKDIGLTKNTPEIFRQAAQRAGLEDAAESCLYVGEDAQERGLALQAGLQVAPHPLLVQEVLDNQRLRYVRLSVPLTHALSPWREELRTRPVVPLHMTGAQGTIIYAIISQRTIAELINMQFGVELLGEPDAPLHTELYILRDDVAEVSGFLSPGGQAARLLTEEDTSRLVVASSPEGIVVALPAEQSLEALHFSQARHGHTLKLLPDPLVLEPPSSEAPGVMRAGLTAAAPEWAMPTLTDAERQELAQIASATMLERIERYSGKRPVEPTSAETINSRHILHPGNARAVTAAATEFEAIGQGRLTVRLRSFTHAGRTLHNVEAELPGSSPELVLVTAHLDSTAASSSPYDAAHDIAPGADDDASGVAAVLTTAERFVAMTGATPLPRTVRFVLFNAEEHGLVGSKVYARQQKSIGAPIVAVFQMDMIAYNQAPPRAWEVHAGYSSSREVEKRSVALARLLAHLAPTVAPQLAPLQIYRSDGGTAGGVDPAEGRSDHASFQMHGYAACISSEDFFVGPTVASPTPEENPNYHQKTDTFVDPDFAADIARVIAAAAWVTAQGPTATPVGARPARAFARYEERARMPRELDTRKASNNPLGQPLRVATGAAARSSASPSGRPRLNALTGTPVTVRPAVPPAEEGSMVDKALAFLQTEKARFGFANTDVTEFVPDPIVQRTSTGSAAVHVHQYYRGLPVFQMTRTVRFAPQGQVVDAPGDNAPLPEGVDIEPRLEAAEAVLKAAQHLANTGAGETQKTRFQETIPLPTVDIDDFSPSVLASFPLPSRPTVFDKGPFENPIPAHLLIFNQPQGPRLAWHTVLTFPDYEDQYVVVVSADEAGGEILYAKSTVHRVLARGNVYEFSPGVSDRRLLDFPRPLTDYPAMPTTPLVDFPRDWVTDKQSTGNSTRATLGVSTTTLTGTPQNGRIMFNPTEAVGDDQKILNIFYFCNYMHDFLHILGFDEAAGNFQSINFTHTGLGNDPVRARAHHGAVNGTANMATGPDGQPPVMNMGLVTATNRHTAFDADVVFHEYTHGLTNRLVGGRMNAHALDEPQSAGMGEGWSDYFALTIQSFFYEREKVVTGDWVVDRPGGIRNAHMTTIIPSSTVISPTSRTNMTPVRCGVRL